MMVVFIAGCHSDYDFSTDYVQIGCRCCKGKTAPEFSCFRFGFPWWCDDNEHSTISGVDLSPIVAVNGKLNGLGISLMSVRNGTVNGVIVAPLCSVQRTTNGVSFSPINVSMNYSPGMQVGLANFNIDFWRPRGGTAVQLALLNVAAEAKVQLGAFNFFCRNETKSMLQIGLINSSPDGLFQFGLLNRNRNSCFCGWFPFFNMSQRIFDLEKTKQEKCHDEQ